ncbi:HdeD family acid-resistance protein [Pseudonocardia acaciae]|uniref:HdeD family acid-resistance protein n=1 Tax=Pseudonocardia acaciae TaxID=551276 RepID=UPI0006872BE2|nr:DUF308 domain-containing protein [Pseudonocardia acaciae]
MADVGESRWWPVAYGVLAVIAGILAVAWPGVTALVLAAIFGIQLLILGLFRTVWVLAVPDTSTATKVIGVLVGILAIIAGVMCLRSPVATAVFLAIVVGLFWLVNGVMELAAGVAGRSQRGRGWAILGGVVGLIAGVVVLSMPVISAVTLAWVLGIVMIVHGAVTAIGAFGRPATTPAS